MQKYSVSTIAKLLNLTERRVQQLSKDDIIPTPEKGKYDLVGSIQGYVKYLQDTMQGRGSTIDTNAEKARLLKNQADKAEMEMKILQEKYVSNEELEFEWSNLIIAFRSKMLSLPSKLAVLLTGTDTPAKTARILEDEIHDALTELSKYGQDEDHPSA